MNIPLPERTPVVAPLVDETPQDVVVERPDPGYCGGKKEIARRLKQIERGILRVS